MGSLFDKNITPEAKKATIDKISKCVDHLDTILGKHPMYLATSSASPTPMPLPFSAGANGSVSTSHKWKHVTEFMKRMEARPAVQAALQAEAA